MGRRREGDGVRTITATPSCTDGGRGLNVGGGGAYGRRVDARCLDTLIARSETGERTNSNTGTSENRQFLVL